MKKTILVLLLCIIGMVASSQSLPIDIGIRAGWNNTKINVNHMEVESKGGYMLGVFARFNFRKLYIEPGFDFSNKKSKIIDYDSELKYRSIDIPVMLGHYIFETSAFNFRGFIGPVASFTTQEINKNLFKGTNKTMWNGRIGIGIDIWKIIFDIEYEFGFRCFGDDARTPQCWNLTFGFKIL